MKKKKTKKKVTKKKVVETGVGIYQESIAFAADQFRLGHSDSKIAEVIKGAFKHLTDANIQFIVHRGSLLIAEQYARDRKSIVALHLKRYNKEIKKCLDKQKEGEDETEEEVDWVKKRNMRIFDLMTCLDVLFQKEKVLQIHNKDTQIKIFNKLNAKVKEKKVMFNLADLSIEEKMEFLTLIEKAKKSQVELFSIKMSDVKEEQVTEDVVHEIVANDNITKITKINDKPKELPEPKKTLDDITKKMQANFAKLAVKKLMDKGASTDKGPKVLDYRKNK